MKILCTGDWHFGLSVGGYDFHDDLIRAIQTIVDAADEADMIVVYGDVFHTSTPSPRSYEAVLALLDELTVPGFLLVGNHDIGVGTVTSWGFEDKRRRIPTPHALEPLKRFRFRVPLHVIDSPGVYEAPGDMNKEFLLVPYLNDIVAQHRWQSTAQEVVEYAFDDASHSGEVMAAFCHLDVEGAQVGSENAVMRGARLGIPSIAQHVAFPVVNGHIHKRQEVGNILMPGSIVATDFSDVDGVWGYMMLEV